MKLMFYFEDAKKATASLMKLYGYHPLILFFVL
jgi:hypothetical protein